MEEFSSLQINGSLPGNDFIRIEFHCTIFVALIGIVASHNVAVVLLTYLLSSVYVLYGTVSQLDFLSKTGWLTEQCIVADQEQAWDYLWVAMVRWLSLVIFCFVAMKLWQWSGSGPLLTMFSNKITILFVINTFVVVTSSSLIEFWFTRYITDDLSVMLYLLLSAFLRFALTFCQKNLSSFHKSALFIVITSNFVLFIVNILFFTFLCQQFIILLSYFVQYQLVITMILLLSLMTDIVYRIVVIGSCVKNLLRPPDQVQIQNMNFQPHMHDSEQTDDTAINSSAKPTSESLVRPQHYEEQNIRIKSSNLDYDNINTNVEAVKDTCEESEDAPISNPIPCMH